MTLLKIFCKALLILSRVYVKEALRNGLNEQWIHFLCVWKESPIYDPQERALLGWVEAVTHVAQMGAPDADFEILKAHFSEVEIIKVTVAIDVWNRLAVGFRFQHPVEAKRVVA